jgi:hypothetical protein
VSAKDEHQAAAEEYRRAQEARQGTDRRDDGNVGGYAGRAPGTATGGSR